MKDLHVAARYSVYGVDLANLESLITAIKQTYIVPAAVVPRPTL